MSPADCQYRSGSEDEGACQLLADFFSTNRGDLTSCSLEACKSCCESRAPSPTSLNPSLASLLLLATVKVIEEDGIPSCDLARAGHLQNWALKNIAVLGAEEKLPDSKKASYQGPCFYLGAQKGERACKSCVGSVRQKEFACGHEDHESTVIRDCINCTDYEPGVHRGEIKTWAVGVTTAPRREPNLPEMLTSLKMAGWGEARIFAEPGSDVAEEGGITVTQRRETMGAWPNFLLGLTELTLLHPQADAYFMCQDDAVFCGGLRNYLERELWLDGKVGVVSLHTPSHQTHDLRPGFFEADVGWNSWGAMAFVFSNASARALLRHPAVINHRNRGMGGGMRNVDSVVGNWCRLSGLPYYLHSPSLCEHIGLTTTLWKVDSLAGRRSSSDFPGEEIDISKWMEEQLPGRDDDEPEAFESGSTGSPATRRSNLAIIALGETDDLASFLDSIEAQSLPPDEKWLPGQSDRDLVGWHCPEKEAPLQGMINRLASDWVMVLQSLAPLEREVFEIPDDDRIGMIVREGYFLVQRSALNQAGGFAEGDLFEVVPKMRALGWVVLDGEVGVCRLESGPPEERAASLNRSLPEVEAEYVVIADGKGSVDFSEDQLEVFRSLSADGRKPGLVAGSGVVQVDRLSLQGALFECRALRSCLPIRGEVEDWIGARLRRNGYTLWGEGDPNE